MHLRQNFLMLFPSLRKPPPQKTIFYSNFGWSSQKGFRAYGSVFQNGTMLCCFYMGRCHTSQPSWIEWYIPRLQAMSQCHGRADPHSSASASVGHAASSLSGAQSTSSIHQYLVTATQPNSAGQTSVLLCVAGFMTKCLDSPSLEQLSQLPVHRINSPQMIQCHPRYQHAPNPR